MAFFHVGLPCIGLTISKKFLVFIWDGLERVREALPEGGPPLQNFSKIIQFLALQNAIEVMLSLTDSLLALTYSFFAFFSLLEKTETLDKKGDPHTKRHKPSLFFHFLDNLNFHH